MKEQVKAILFDFKDAGWSAQKVEKELGFSNGSLGKAISDYRFSKLLELHKKEIGKPLATTKEVKVQDANKTTGEVKPPEQPTTNYTVNTKAPKTLEELKVLCPIELKGFDRSEWISKERIKYSI